MLPDYCYYHFLCKKYILGNPGVTHSVPTAFIRMQWVRNGSRLGYQGCSRLGYRGCKKYCCKLIFSVAQPMYCDFKKILKFRSTSTSSVRFAASLHKNTITCFQNKIHEVRRSGDFEHRTRCRNSNNIGFNEVDMRTYSPEKEGLSDGYFHIFLTKYSKYKMYPKYLLTLYQNGSSQCQIQINRSCEIKQFIQFPSFYPVCAYENGRYLDCLSRMYCYFAPRTT